MSARFVILHHRLAESEHWDLMLEEGEVLLTWQLLAEPVDASRLPIPAKPLGDHRKAYLTFEGPVSGDRGHVTRVDEGNVAIRNRSPDRLLIELDSPRFRGRFALTRGPGGWVFDRAAEDVAG